MSQSAMHAQKLVESDEFHKLRKLYPELDFSDEIEAKPEIAEFLCQVVQKEAMQAVEPLSTANAPKLDDDMSMYFLINNLPKCKEDKVQKLVALIMKTLTTKGLKIEEEDIEIPINPATGETDGVAFVKMANEEQARFGAAVFDGFKLTKNNIFASCLLPDFEKVMQTAETFSMPQSAASLQSLRAPLFDLRREQYMYKSGKNVHINFFDRNQAMNGQKDETLAVFESTVDSKPTWSPKGTYLVLIKAEKVLFMGGENMAPIITIPQSKVTHVMMSPCERYVLTYSPKGDSQFTVWNFSLVEQIREFLAEKGENQDTYKWSFDGNYLAKQFRTEAEGDAKVKEGISVYELPSMQLLANDEGKKKSITIEHIVQWEWAPHRNLLCYTCCPNLTEEEKAKTNIIDPRVGFMKIPQRNQIGTTNFKNSEQLMMYMHPQGYYLALANLIQKKKTKEWIIEIFDIEKGDMVPHQQIQVKREVLEFSGVYWEPYHRKIAIHTLAKKETERGRTEYTLEPKRSGVDIYEMTKDDTTGFLISLIGYHPAEKVQGLVWSPCGDVFALMERDGPSTAAKTVWSFYIIEEMTEQQQESDEIKPIIRGKGGKQLAMQAKNMLKGEQVRYEFRKTARQDTSESKTVGVWDEFGRFFTIYGVKGMMSFGASEKFRNVRIYTIFGEPLQSITQIPDLQMFAFRPRPNNILSIKEQNALRKDYRKLYSKLYKEEEKAERTSVQEEVRLKNKAIRDEFLSNYYLPLRRKYEADIDKYIKMWPLKDSDMSEKEEVVTHVYNYGDLIETKKIDRQ